MKFGMLSCLVVLVLSLAGNVFLAGHWFECNEVRKDPLRQIIEKLVDLPQDASASKPSGYYMFSDGNYHNIAILDDDGTFQIVTFYDEGRWRLTPDGVVETSFYLAPDYEYFGDFKGNAISASQGDYFNVYRRLDLEKAVESNDES